MPKNKTTDPVQQFRTDIQNKLDSFDDPQEKLDFIVEFHSAMNTLQNRESYSEAWFDLLKNQFLPMNDNGTLNRPEFEKRMEEVAQWQLKKNVQIGRLVGQIENSHSSDWITDMVFTSRPGRMYYAMRNDILHTVMSNSGTVFLRENINDPYKPLSQGYVRTLDAQQPEIKILAERGRCYSNDNKVKDVFDEAIQKAGTDAEKQNLKAQKEAWKLRDEELKQQESRPSEEEVYHREVNTKKKIWDSMSLDFITDPDTIKEIRKGQAQELSQEHLKSAHSDFIELLGKTQQALDRQSVVKCAEYQTLRSEMKNLKDSLTMYGDSKEHRLSLRNAEEKLIHTCDTYLGFLQKKYPKKAHCSPVVQLMEAAKENCQLSKENAWTSGVDNFNTLAAELEEKSDKRKDFFGRKHKDSEEYKRVLNAVKAFKERIGQGDMNIADFRSLSDQVKTSCDAYLSARNPKSPEGKERYELIQNIWNASSRLSRHYTDKVTVNPFSMEANRDNIRHTVAEPQPDAVPVRRRHTTTEKVAGNVL